MFKIKMLNTLALVISVIIIGHQFLWGNEKVDEEIKYYFGRSIYSAEYKKLPKILNQQDIITYYNIYQAQRLGNFEQADVLIEQLEDDVLLGYMYYFRFTAKNYNSSFKELGLWLSKYDNLAVSSDVYALALKKAPKNRQNTLIKPSTKFNDRFLPVYLRKDFFDKDDFINSQNNNQVKAINISQNVFTGVNKSNVKNKNNTTKRLDKYLKNGKTLTVKNILLDKKTKKVLNDYTYRHYASILSKLYFLDGQDKLAVEWAEKAIRNNPYDFPEAIFNLGLTYYRLKEYNKSKFYFAILSTNYNNNDSVVKGAYWLAKVSFLMGDMEDYFKALNTAAGSPYNFYGLMAKEELGLVDSSMWEQLSYDSLSLDVLLKNEHGRRALALLQFGLLDWAEQELVFLVNNMDKSLSKEDSIMLLKVIITMAENIPMPALSLKLAGEKGKYYGFSNLTYPVFLLNLENGYKVDPALLLAVIRKESLFFTSARSGAGAVGLMQVLPSTAQYVINKYNLEQKNMALSYSLTLPVYNMEIGQNYLNILLNNKSADNNLIYVLAGYNAGFSLVTKWKEDKHRKPEDPLFFIESIPYGETRDYVKKVLSNYWIYQSRLNITPHSLIAMVQGGQPIYYESYKDEVEIDNLTIK